MAWCEADERGRRLVAAEAFAAGYGGIAAVAMATTVGPRPSLPVPSKAAVIFLR